MKQKHCVKFRWSHAIVPTREKSARARKATLWTQHAKRVGWFVKWRRMKPRSTARSIWAWPHARSPGVPSSLQDKFGAAKNNISCAGYLSKSSFMSPNSARVTKIHKPRSPHTAPATKVTSHDHQILRLPPRVTSQDHQIPRLPQTSTSQDHHICTAPANRSHKPRSPYTRRVTSQYHQTLHLPQKVTTLHSTHSLYSLTLLCSMLSKNPYIRSFSTNETSFDRHDY